MKIRDIRKRKGLARINTWWIMLMAFIFGEQLCQYTIYELLEIRKYTLEEIGWKYANSYTYCQLKDYWYVPLGVDYKIAIVPVNFEQPAEVGQLAYYDHFGIMESKYYDGYEWRPLK